MKRKRRYSSACARLGTACVGLLSLPFLAMGAEVTVQNDSLAKGEQGSIQAGFVAGESAASWLTSPCDGDVVAVQVFWRSVTGGSPQSLEQSITVFDAGGFPFPGKSLALIEGPVMTDGVVNEFRWLDENQTIPLIVPVTNGQEFIVSFTFFNTPPALGPSVVTDADGCQAGKNAIFAIPGGWLSSCLVGVTGDFVIRAVVDCGAQPGACCLATGNCADNMLAADCAAAGGAFEGEGSTCAGTVCREACCLPPSSCVDLTVSDCSVAGGFNQGPGTDCATTDCFPTGACCNPDGSCDDDMDASDCVAAGGAYQGNDSTCAGVSCPQPEGACCLSKGGCIITLSQADCNVFPGASWGGPLTDCTDGDSNGTADACEGCPLAAQPAPEFKLQPSCGGDPECFGESVCIDGGCYVPKNKYISLSPGNAGDSVAIRVTLSASTGFPGVVNSSWWVQPHDGGDPPDVFRLGCDTHYQDWSTEPAVIHVGDVAITSGASYAVEAIHIDCPTGDPGNYSPALSLPTVSVWGDCTGPDGPPDGDAGFSDILEVVKGFQNSPDAANDVWLDVDPDRPDGAPTFADILAVVLGFQGNGYPYGGPIPCP